jgi:hypothetical protein
MAGFAIAENICKDASNADLQLIPFEEHFKPKSHTLCQSYLVALAGCL